MFGLSPIVLLWVVLLVSALMIAGRNVTNKWILDNDVSPCTVLLLSSLLYAAAAVLVFLTCGENKWVCLTTDVTQRIQWQQWIVWIGVILLGAFASYWFLRLLRVNNVATLSPTRSVLVIVSAALLGIFALKEKISVLDGTALAVMVVGVCIMIYASWKQGGNI